MLLAKFYRPVYIRPETNYLVRCLHNQQGQRNGESGTIKLSFSEKFPPDRNYILKLFRKVLSFYEDITGLPPVRVAQNHVVEIQDKLKVIQERRRPLLTDLIHTRDQMQKLHLDMQTCIKTDPLYVDLVRKNVELSQKESRLKNLFEIADEEERSMFTELTNSVKKSHELERLQNEQSKYFMMVMSLILTLLGAFTYPVYNHFRTAAFANQIKLENKVTNDNILMCFQYMNELKAMLVAKEKKDSLPKPSEPGWIEWASKPIVSGVKALKFW